MTTDTDAPDYWDSLRPQPPTDTDALLATVREATAFYESVIKSGETYTETVIAVTTEVRAALDSLAAELEKQRLRATQFDNGRRFQKQRAEAAEAELERVKEENSRLNSEHWKDAERTAMDQEIQRVKAERDEWKENAEVWNGAEEDLAKALSALREIAEDTEPNHYSRLQGIARDRLVEIEGEA